jgi:hypothetical protein
VRHSTGLPCVGLNGTVVSSPQSEHFVRVSARTRDPLELRFALHCLQRFGSFMNCLSWKKTCSPAVNTNSAPQSIHVSIRSVNTMAVPRRKGSQKSAMTWGACRSRFPVFVRLAQQGPRAAIKGSGDVKSLRGSGRLGCVRLACAPAKRLKFEIATRRLNLVFLLAPSTSSAECAETARRDSVF